MRGRKFQGLSLWANSPYTKDRPSAHYSPEKFVHTHYQVLKVASMGIKKEIIIPPKDEKLAEFVGIMLGDGNIFSSKKRGIHQIKVTNNSITDREFMINFVKPLIESLFGLKVSLSFDKGRKGMNLRVASENLLEFLSSIGLIPGDKIKNGITIPNWIKDDNQLLISCIRGLLDTDGTVFHSSKTSKRLIIGFKNNNRILLEDVRESLINLEFHPTKIIKNAIFIGRQHEIELFVRRIDFNNPKHKMKIAPI